MSTTDLSSSPRVSRRLRWLLIGSLALNVLVLGSAAGLGLRMVGKPPPPAGAHASGFGPWGAGLTREDHKALRKSFEAEGYDFRADIRADRADRARLVEGLRAEPFDADAMAEVIAGLEARAASRMALGNRMILNHVLAMTPEARRAMAERIEAAETARRAERRERPQRDSKLD